MDHFEIDRQTIDDLGIFSAEGTTVYSLFNLVKTIGGEKKLLQMMETPSFDINILNSRKQTIKYFYDYKTDFPVKKKDVDFIEHYLAYNRDPLKDNLVDASINKARNYFNSGNDNYTISEGIKAIHKLLIILNDFYKSVKLEDANQVIADIVVFLSDLLQKRNMQKLIAENPEKKLTFLELSHYDNLFRKKEISAIKNLLNTVYELDVYIAVATSAEKNGFCFADYSGADDCFVEVSGLYHPCIKNPVANDAKIGIGKNLMFLTGANMAGKSSFIKALGLCIYLSHIGFPVPAKGMKTGIFKGLITTINISDNISAGYSHYFSEVNRIKKTAQKISGHDKLLIVFDELFRGTNVKDAFNASLAIIKALSNIKNSIFIVSTHIVELANELRNTEGISFNYFNAQIVNGEPLFDYRLREGVSSETLGYFIFEREGIIDLLEKAAR